MIKILISFFAVLIVVSGSSDDNLFDFLFFDHEKNDQSVGVAESSTIGDMNDESSSPAAPCFRSAKGTTKHGQRYHQTKKILEEPVRHNWCEEELEKSQKMPAVSVPRVKTGTYTKYTKRHKEIVNELVASSSDAGKPNASMFEDASKIFEREGLAPMPYSTFYMYKSRSRDMMNRVNPVDFARRPKDIYASSRLDSIISDVFHREERRREDGKKRKHSSGLHSQFIEEAFRNGLGEQAQAMAHSTFKSKICRLRERGYL